MVSFRPGRLRTWAAGLCVAGAVGLVPVGAVTMWAENTLLSTSGFQAAVRPIPTDPAVERQLIDNVQRQVSAALDRSPAPARVGARLLGAGTVRQLLADAVPAILDSAAFQRAWKAALSAAHAELVKVLRDQSALLTLTSGGLDVTVGVALKQLVDLAGLPGRVASRLPAYLPVTVTLIEQRDLRRAARVVQLTDEVSRVLIPAVTALGLGGLLLARRRRRTVIVAFTATAITSGALDVITIWGQSHGARPIIADVAVCHLVAPLTTTLGTIVIMCALAATALTAVRWIAAHTRTARRGQP